ncbi:MAG: acetate--CoA ligase family protein [Aeromicrobium erythreum]
MTTTPTPDPKATCMSDPSPVEILLNARSVAIIGASDNGVKPSGRTQRYLRAYGFDGTIYPVNPSRETVQGLRAWASIADLPETPDLAVVVLPAAAVEQAVQECGALGIPFAIVFASGYAETGPEGEERQRSLQAVARAAGVRVLGPNSVGAVSIGNHLTATFMTGLDQDRFVPTDDGIAFVSQSGAMGGFILNMAHTQGVGVGRFLSTGNEVDLGLPELVEQLVDEGSTRVVLGYVEGIRDGARLERALVKAREADVPVALMKVGRSERGAQAAASHTGALAGAEAVYDGVFERHGVHRALDVEHLLDLGRVFAGTARAQGGKVSIVTLSGGAGVLMTDYAEDLGLDVFAWDEHWQQRMANVLPPYAAVANPIDTTGAIASDQQILIDALGVCLENPETDMVLVLLGNLEAEEDSICERLIELASTATKPILVTWVGGSGRPARLLSAAGVPTFSEPLRALRAAAALARHGTPRAVDDGEPVRDQGGDLSRLVEARRDGARYLDEVAAKQLLAAHGVRTVREVPADDASSAWAAAEALGLPVVLKLLSDEVAHKSEHDAVRVGLADRDAVVAAADDVLAIAARLGLRDQRVVVQEMVPPETELILGMSVDPVFGPVVVVGTGGVLTEIVADVSLRPAPVSVPEARTMIDGLRGASLLRGARGRTPVDEEQLAQTIARFSRLAVAAAPYAESIEVNPLLVARDGSPVAVDALVVLPSSQETS